MTRQFWMLLVLAAAIAAFVAAPAALARSAGTSVTVSAGSPSDFAFKLSAKSVPHGAITFKVTNVGKAGLPHDFFLCSSPTTVTAAASLPNTCKGKGTAQIAQHASATLNVTVAKAGTYEYLCTVPGHAAGGMKGILKVT